MGGVSVEGRVIRDSIDVVLLSPINFVDQHDLACLLLKISVYRGVKKTLLLKIVDEIPSTLLHEVVINGSLGVNRNQFLHLPPCQERNDRESGASRADCYQRANFHFERHIDAI